MAGHAVPLKIPVAQIHLVVQALAPKLQQRRFDEKYGEGHVVGIGEDGVAMSGVEGGSEGEARSRRIAKYNEFLEEDDEDDDEDEVNKEDNEDGKENDKENDEKDKVKRVRFVFPRPEASKNIKSLIDTGREHNDHSGNGTLSFGI